MSDLISHPVIDSLIAGLTNIPTPHLIGIFLGMATFTITITTVIFLLVKGGTMGRLREELSAEKEGRQANHITTSGGGGGEGFAGKRVLVETALKKRRWMLGLVDSADATSTGGSDGTECTAESKAEGKGGEGEKKKKQER